jgi:diacylglycerol kinase (ATP)
VSVHVLLNPAAAGGATLRRWQRIEPLAASLFPDLTVHRSARPGDLASRARQLSNEDALVLAAGGDGTSHEVVNGLIAGRVGDYTQARLGWLPLGSGNDMARAHRVPLGGAEALRHYHRAQAGAALVDVGMVQWRAREGHPSHRVFGNSLTFGLSARVLELVERMGKPLGGKASYFLATLRAIASSEPTALTLDGARARFRLVAILNGTSFGAGMRITPDARLDDGLLDLLTVDPISPFQTAMVFPRIYWAGHLRNPAVRVRRVRALTIEAEGPLPFEADGELYHGNPPFEITVLPGALRVARLSTNVGHG